MSKRVLVGLLMLLPWGTIAKAGDYDPYLCQAFAHNLDPAFTVPAHGQYRLTIDMRHCGGMVQNYQITLMGAKREVPSATLTVLDSNGRSVGVCDAGQHCVLIGDVPSDAVYTVVVTYGSKRDESCILSYTGAI